MMSAQSTNHLLMIEPASFYANPETMETNVYQVEESESREEIFAKALKEFHDFRGELEGIGVQVTVSKGFEECPDMVFPNCLSTHREGKDDGGTLFIYPMLNANRQAERDPALITRLSEAYETVEDWSGLEDEGQALESTASIVMDRENKIGYAALSARTDKNLVRLWCADMGYSPEIFETQSHAGKPVYHTDCVMWIGTSLAGVCSDAIIEKDRARVVNRLRMSREVVEFNQAQLQAFCGNALEVLGTGGQRYLAMSSRAYEALEPEQEALILNHFAGIVHSPLPTLEKYGGGSARCMLMELF